MNRLWTWRAGLTMRERRMVDFAGALTGLIVLLYGVVLPIGAAYDAASQRHEAAVRRSAALVAQVKALDAVPAPRPDGALDQQVAVSAQEAGLVVQSLQPRGRDRVVVTVAGAPTAATLRWLDHLGGTGLGVEVLALRPLGDGTVALDVTLRRP